MFLYDTTVNLDREVACFWGTKLNGAGVLFFANKYLTVISNIFSLAAFSGSFFTHDVSQGFSVSVGGDQLELTFYTGRRACAPLPPSACMGVYGLGCLLVSGVFSCAAFQQVGNVVALVQMIPAAGKYRVRVVHYSAIDADSPRIAFSALRAYVLSKNKLLGLVVLSLSLAPVVVNLVSIRSGTYYL